ncbi:MAG: S24 family peptidase [Peptococcaceae bacterium]|nr:S24 family peptidase [Peptococcaceae bacterium]
MLGSIACGEPIFADEDFEGYVEAGANIDADFCLRANGDSMIGARIHDGDIVFIKQQPLVENGQIAAVLIDDEATLKRFYYDKANQIIQLMAENPAYPPIIKMQTDLENIRILGRAIAFQSNL